MSSELEGVRVVVTRSASQTGELKAQLLERGADVVELPLLEIRPALDPRPLERAAAELALFDWLVLTSANAVEPLLEACGGAVPSRLQVAVVGAATARALERGGVTPTLVAAEPRAEGLAAELGPRVRRRRRVLLPQAEDARSVLGDSLEAAGAEVVRVIAYRKTVPESAPEQARGLFAAAPWGWVTFTSPSTAENLAAVLGAAWAEGRSTLDAASIGPVTSAALRRLGVEPAAEAATPSDLELAAAIAAAVTRRRGNGRS